MAMFEVGKTYTIATWEDGGKGESANTVLEVDGPLIKIMGPPGTKPMILNTNSPYFVSAQESEY